MPARSPIPADDLTKDALGGDTPGPPSHAPAAPRLGEYRVVRELGRGGMGIVYELEDVALGRRVAAKVLLPELARKPDSLARFLREARAAAAIEHDNVVPILHIGGEDGTPYLVMPLLKGETLSERLKRGRLTVEEVVRIGRDIASGLAAAHARGLVHRDLKPANIWLDAGTDRARVLDFGLARQEDGGDALTDSGALMGTPAYMAPELLEGEPATARADLFSLGAVLYECATGVRAFGGPTISAIFKAVAEHHPAPALESNPDLPPETSALIGRLMAKSPGDRPASANDTLVALGGAVDRGRTPAIASRSKRRTVWFASAIALLILVAAGLYLATQKAETAAVTEPTPPTKSAVPPVPRYRGKLDVLVERSAPSGGPRLLRLDQPGALPLRQTDKFRIEGEVDPPAYLYVVWVDPGHDVTPVYPWSAAVGWGSRPAHEELVGKLSLPENRGNRYTAPAAAPGVATMVLFASATRFDAPDEVIERWFKELPELPLPPGGDGAAVWFDDYTEVRDPGRLRTFGEVSSDDPFAGWQDRLHKSLGGKAAFQTAVSFARTGGK